MSSGPGPMRVVQLYLEGVRQLVTDEIAETGTSGLRQDHPEVGVACLLALGDDLVQGAAQGSQPPSPGDRDPVRIGTAGAGSGDDQCARLVRFLTEVDRQRRAG